MRPENFDASLGGAVALNEAAKVFGFEAKFDAAGFGDAAEKQVPARTVAYIFRERGGTWEHRNFSRATPESVRRHEPSGSGRQKAQCRF